MPRPSSRPAHALKSLALLGAALWFFAVGDGFAASPTPAATGSPTASGTATESATPAAPALAPIPLAEVAAQAESATIALHEIEVELASEEPLLAANGELSALLREIDARVGEGSKVLALSPSLETLRDLETGWQKLNESLDQWARDLTRRAVGRDQEVARLSQLAKTWELTSKQAQSSGEARELKDLLQRTDALIGSIKHTREAVQKRRAKILTLQNRVADVDAQLTTALAAVDLARVAAVNRLFASDSPPIWSVEVRLGAGGNLVQESLRQQLTALRAYADRQSVKFLVHAILFGLLLAAIYWARRRVQPWAEEEPAGQRAAVVFEVPFAMATALSLVAGSWLYPEAPPLFWAFLGAAALIPAIAILRRVVEVQFLPILNALVGFYFVDQVRSIAASLPVLSRLLFLGEMLGGILFFAWLIWPRRSGETTAPPSRTISAGARIAIGFFAAAFLANALGYVSLAKLLGNAVLRSGYLAVTLYAATRITDGLIMGALSVWPLTELGMVQRHRSLIWHRMRRIIQGGALLLWGFGTLDMLSLRTTAVETAKGVLTASLALGSLNLSLGDLLAFGVTVWAAFALSRFLRFALEQDVYPRVHLARGLPYAISTILHYLVLLVGFFMAAAALGIDMTRFTILAGAFGVGMGFGLQNIINNFVSGLILLFERPVKVGDVVQMDTASGVVDRIGIRASIIRTSSGSEIIVPNGKLISDQVTNWTLSNRQRGIEIPIGVAYGVDPCRVLALLQELARAHPRVAAVPAPKALLVRFGADALQFELQAWTDQFEEWSQIRSDLAVAINAAFIKEGIVMPYTQHDLHLRSIAPELLQECLNRPPQ